MHLGGDGEGHEEEADGEERGETLEVAYASKDLALQSQVMRRADQIGEILADLEKRERY